MPNKMRQEFDKVYRNRLSGYYLGKTGQYSFSEERLFWRIPQRILSGEPLSVTLVEDLVIYGHKLSRNEDTVIKCLGEVLSALAIATEIDRIADIYRDLRSADERTQLNRVVERNARLEKYITRVHEENREWLTEDASLVLAGGELNVRGHLNTFADTVYCPGYVMGMGSITDKRHFTRQQKINDEIREKIEKEKRKAKKQQKCEES